MKRLGRTSLPLTLGLGLMTLLAAPLIAQEPAKRVAALGGSVTEIAVALGAQDRLIARDSTSTWPQSVLALPDVGYIRALSPEGVLSVSPDLIVAEAGAGPAEAVEVLRTAGVPFIQVSGDPTPAGVVAKITDVAAALRLPEQGAALASRVQAGLDAAVARAAGVADKKRVLFVLSVTGGRVMAGGEGSSADGIIALAGGINAATGFQGYKPMTDEAILTAAPDVIVMMQREGNLAIADKDLQSQAALGQTPAVKNGKIVRMDGMLMLGFGPRTPDAAEALYQAIYGAGG
jgi:iron complex transport system substrate-binding protein